MAYETDGTPINPKEFTLNLANSMLDGSVFDYPTKLQLNIARSNALKRAKKVVNMMIIHGGCKDYLTPSFLEECEKEIIKLETDFG